MAWNGKKTKVKRKSKFSEDEKFAFRLGKVLQGITFQDNKVSESHQRGSEFAQKLKEGKTPKKPLYYPYITFSIFAALPTVIISAIIFIKTT